jgi:hypothetical protein
MANGWLHTGSLVCPACQEVCGDQFAKIGQRCKPGANFIKLFFFVTDKELVRLSMPEPNVIKLFTSVISQMFAIILSVCPYHAFAG